VVRVDGSVTEPARYGRLSEIVRKRSVGFAGEGSFVKSGHVKSLKTCFRIAAMTGAGAATSKGSEPRPARFATRKGSEARWSKCACVRVTRRILRCAPSGSVSVSEPASSAVSPSIRNVVIR